MSDSGTYSLKEGVEQLLKGSSARFRESVDVAIRLSTGGSKSGDAVRGVAVLPKGIGRDVKVAVFAKGEYAQQAREAGADVVGDEDLVERIKKGEKLEVDWCIATPDLMPQISAIAKVLGPKGLMPNPKFGTVTFDVGKMIGIVKSGQIKFKSDRYGIIHAKIGDVGFSCDDLVENMQALLSVIQSLKPTTVKGSFLKTIFLNSTMGRSYKISGLG